MATVPSNLYQKASLKGDREDLLDKIFNTDPTETPVLSGSGRQTATNTLHYMRAITLDQSSSFIRNSKVSLVIPALATSTSCRCSGWQTTGSSTGPRRSANSSSGWAAAAAAIVPADFQQKARYFAPRKPREKGGSRFGARLHSRQGDAGD